MNDRQPVPETFQTTPEAAAISALQDELGMLTSIREGLAQSERGEGVSHEQVAAMLLAHPKGQAEATAWCKLLRQTQATPAARALTDADIAAEVATVRASQ